MYAANAIDEALVIVVHGHRYAVPMERVAGVRLYVAETPMPGLPACVRGVIEHNGTPVHVVDAAQRLGRGRSKPNERACIVFFENVPACGVVALLVDEIEHVVTRNFVDGEQPFLPRRLVTAVIADENQTLPLLDIDRFFDMHSTKNE